MGLRLRSTIVRTSGVVCFELDVPSRRSPRAQPRSLPRIGLEAMTKHVDMERDGLFSLGTASSAVTVIVTRDALKLFYDVEVGFHSSVTPSRSMSMSATCTSTPVATLRPANSFAFATRRMTVFLCMWDKRDTAV